MGRAGLQASGRSLLQRRANQSLPLGGPHPGPGDSRAGARATGDRGIEPGARSELLQGLVLRARAGFYDIETAQGVITARLRGKFRKRSAGSDLIAVGDRVELSLLPDGSASVEQILPRKRVLSRRAPGRDKEQVLVANPDQTVFVFACADPDPNFRMLDRLLVVAERESIPAVICANKLDLVQPRSARDEFGVYEAIGYRVLYTSAISGKGVSELRGELAGKLSVLAGPSGVGKSSLLNQIQPGLGLRTESIGVTSRRGTHTTVAPELVPLNDGGYVADTPGLKAFALWDIEPDELDAYFREIAPLVEDCEFSDCTHEHEPGCAVRAAVEAGEIDPGRYDSYLKIRSGEGDINR